MSEWLAIDYGNGFVKGVSKHRTIVAPSAIALESSAGDSSISSIFNESELYHIFHSQLDDKNKYIWGEGIKQAVDPGKLLHTYTHERRYENKRFKLLCQFVLAELAADFEKDNLDVTLVTGMPSAEIKTDEDTMLKEFLKGRHVIKRDGLEKVINIVDVRVMEQPLGTLLNLYLSTKGEIHKKLKTSTITVIDFGSGTTIVDTYKNMKRIKELSETIYTGMNDIYRNIKDRLVAKYGLKTIDITQIEDGFKNDFTLTISDRKKYPFNIEATEAINEVLNQTISDIDRIIPNRESIDEFIATGGGTVTVGSSFKELFNEESLILVDDPQESNVNGYGKFAAVINK